MQRIPVRIKDKDGNFSISGILVSFAHESNPYDPSQLDIMAIVQKINDSGWPIGGLECFPIEQVQMRKLYE